MSNSSFSTMKSCEAKYAHRKIYKSEIDSDVETNLRHLNIGSCFHELLELTHHTFEGLSTDEIYGCFEKHGIDSDADRGMIIAMCKKYAVLHKKSELTCIGCEDEIGDDDVIGFIDAILQDKNGFYYITDLKTAARLDGNLLARLKNDPQLNLYAYYRGIIEEKYGLDPNKFAGVLYRVTRKSTIKMKASDSVESFADRVFDNIDSYSIFIPASELDPVSAYLAVVEAKKKALRFRDEGLEPKKNFSNCFEWYRPCEYFSKCYGYLHSESEDNFLMEDTDDVKPMCQPLSEEDRLMEELGL